MRESSLREKPRLDSDFVGLVVASSTLDLYAFALRCQACIVGDTIFGLLHSISCWREARTVFDVGCGPGEVAEQLVQRSLLHNKLYLGIDKERIFIERANEKRLPESLEFRCLPLQDFAGQSFDLILSIATLQHLGDLRATIFKLRSLLNRGGHMIFFDALPDRPPWSTPEVPLVAEMFRLMSKQHTAGQRNDRCLLELEEFSPQLGLRILESEMLEIPIQPYWNETYACLSYCRGELAKRIYGVHLNPRELLAQLEAWLSAPGTVALRGWGKMVVQTI